jgi:hypothetical protein
MSHIEQRTAVDAVAAWHRAVNAQDVESALALCSGEVAVAGPHGTGHGPEIMRAWLQRSGIRLEPQHELREVEGHVLVHERAQWTTEGAPTGAPTGRPVDTWVVFRAASGVIESVS